MQDPKQVVLRFNHEVIEQGNLTAFHELMAEDFVNHSAPPGAPQGREGMWNTFDKVLRPAISEMKVSIEDQLVEGDKVTTRKTITGRLTGTLLGVEPTNRPICIEVIDIVRISGGRYVEHWGVNTLPAVLAQLRADEVNAARA